MGARVVVAVDGNRLLNDAGVLGRSAIIDNSGRQWQLVVFRGDDLAFRLRFRKAASQPSVIVVTRGGERSGLFGRAASRSRRRGSPGE